MKQFFAIIILLSIFPATANQLKNHPSPYLALHGNDPVDWMEWGKPALEKAKKENKLLVVSVGYFSCHWCHVMQRESFSDKGIAKKLNKNYISVKVDRELNPVLDKRLIEFVSVTNGTAGWPLNVFITPEGYPLVGATYLPRKNLASVLDQLDEKWKKERESLSSQAKEMNATLVSMLEKQERSVEGNMKELAGKFVDVAMESADTLQGGFGDQLKFPQIPQLWALLKLNKLKKNNEADEFIYLTLKQMAQRGLHDELAGGFYRYAVDPNWDTPHFEKMIYTNALMPLLYFDAAGHYGNDSYKKIALETLYFLQNEMLGENNAFISSLSAVDDKNVEGGFYLWQQQELKKILTADELNMANLYWKLNQTKEFEAGNLPRQTISIAELAKRLSMSPQQATNGIIQLKEKLKTHRNKTRKLPRDNKLLSGMNGLALAAFSEGIKHDKALRPTGEKLSRFLISLWDGKELRRSAANNDPGTLYDYAAVSWGLINWGIAVNDVNAKQVGGEIAKTTWDKFYINKTWLEDPDSLLPQGLQQAHIADSALVSAEALLLEASNLSNDSILKQKANEVLNNITRALETDLFSYASLLSVAK